MDFVIRDGGKENAQRGEKRSIKIDFYLKERDVREN
jgi:hypothetical protein